MLVNLNELSASELLELAKKKQQEEQESARRSAKVARLAQLRKKREQLLADQERALLILDKELQSLQQRRTQLVTSHQTALAALDKEMAEVSAGARASEMDVPAPAAEPAVGAPEPQPETRPAPSVDPAAAILNLLKGRVDMSDSLLRERLRGLGIDAGRFAKAIAQLVREGKVVSKGAGNYALKKRL
ncbi:MAG: hypothetical protein M0R77_09575 [Gammaproteobacteria bacterium]|nr:hypothetical protein [Gammaproteobacteria bacterium]